MDAAAAVPAAIVGLLFLGDSVQPGRGWLVVIGFVFTLGGVIGLSYYAEPQHHHQVAGRHRQSATGEDTPTPLPDRNAGATQPRTAPH